MEIRRDRRTGYYFAVVRRAGKRAVSIPLHTRNKVDAVQKAKLSRLEEIERLAQAEAITAETIGRILAGRKVSNAEIFPAWREHLEMSDLAPLSVHQYSGCLRAFFRFFPELSRAPVTAITSRHVEGFVNPTDSSIRAGTRRQRLIALRNYFEYCQAQRFIVKGPSYGIPVRMHLLSHRQKEKRKVLPFTEAEIQLLRRELTDWWRLAVMIADETGLRLGDVASLEWDSLSEPGQITVWTDKHDKRVSLGISEELTAELWAMRRTHARFVFPEQAKLNADPKTRSKLSLYFTRELNRLGIFGRSFHCLRHTFATRHARLGASIDEIREKLGHANVATTGAYLH